MPKRVKPLSELSPAYRKRIERGLARGLPRSVTRGHAGPVTLSLTELRILADPKRNSLLSRLIDDLDVSYRRTGLALYRKSVREEFERREFPEQNPTSFDKLLLYLSDVHEPEAEFARALSGPSQTLFSQIKSGKYPELLKLIGPSEEDEF